MYLFDVILLVLHLSKVGEEKKTGGPITSVSEYPQLILLDTTLPRRS
jgi:hypothetical protein